MNSEKLAAAEKFWIAGHGAEGRASEKFLRKHFPAMPIEIVDPVREPVKFESGIWVISPGIPRRFFENIPAENQTSGTEIFFEFLDENLRKKVIGISGTKGKSTTTKFVAEFLENAGKSAIAAGNFGVPLLEILDDFLAEKIEFVVAELSSYQLENLKISPGIAIFLNFSPDHLDRHGDAGNYFHAKSNLWQHQKSDDFLIVPENLGLRFSMLKLPGRLILSRKISAKNFAETSVFRAPHFLENFGTAEVVRQILKLPETALKKTAENFIGLPHRLEFFAEKNGRKFYDDSICTNPGSAAATVKFFGGTLAAIVLGGQNRGLSYEILAEEIRKKSPRALVVVLDSEISKKVLETCDAHDLEIVRAENLDEAVKIIFEKTNSGSIVLCPAAPSYDRWKNFHERGNAWQTAVKNFG
ncbi:UDP-N-acetylmuramoyl-L-alanine--D-glutamate ligase [bacterium]|jgi:UDP-N-acetylmuramoylalanine--D-glutamate ligase|nr:UDP-N-acetylmuramoyl-L-alanine--D-glutamate ligase [bacterium]MBT6831858.1 UDP-N-acetylmuramoyl-L-alanine--D-glutamate ligase [bacterium]MBT6996247.1 UDP-N-acetylmuramoyl-L-alanine--D-glutamate ligase [bacterium]MBT7772586.1 UDP-N-acetylmuramoyl-L-alanine--D-glutamate ligase [bacterium]